MWRDGTVLMRVVARACFEPHRGKNPATGHFVLRPNQTVDRAFTRPATEPSDAKRLASTQPSGHSVRVAKRRWETDMAKFVLMFHGGESSEEPSPEVMDRWMGWFGQLGDAVVDMGAPFGASATIASDGTPSEGSGPDPATGY